MHVLSEDFQFAVSLPSYCRDITSRLQDKNWLIHNLKCEDYRIYNPAEFIAAREYEDRKYTVVLDLNVYEYLLNGIKRNKKNKLHLDAISLLIFCQISEIEVDPVYAVYEKVNYGTEKLEEITNDLSLFNNLNNQNPHNLAKYLFTSSDLIIEDIVETDKADLSEKLTRYKRLTEWDSLYLHILAITQIHTETPNDYEENIKKFIDWSICKFRLSMPAIIFASVLFAKEFPQCNNQTRKNVMKFKSSQDSLKRKNSLINMTWDLYFMNRFFRRWTGKKENEEFLFASADKVLTTLLRIGIKLQDTGSCNHLLEFLSPSTVKYIDNVDEMAKSTPNRIFNSDDWTPEYRSNLIEDFEKILLQ